MKANQKSLLANDTRAQVGIGTMIVFIATILVAATAAAVLIDTSGKLQERSSSTGTEATSQVASNLVLKQIVGESNVGGTHITSVTYTLALAPGASSVDLEELKLRISDGDHLVTYDYAGAAAAGVFTVEFLRGDGPTVMLKGNLVNIVVPFSGADASDGNVPQIPPRTSSSGLFIPEVGSQMDASFKTPASWSANEQIILR